MTPMSSDDFDAWLATQSPHLQSTAGPEGTGAMAKRLTFSTACTGDDEARLGGPALIGGVAPWPATPEGRPLTLAMSLPAAFFLNAHCGTRLPQTHFVSVFTWYDAKEYFLDCVTYHGHREELAVIREGYTRVLLHAKGEAMSGPVAVPAMAIGVDASGGEAGLQAPKIGGEPDLLQNQPLALPGERFVLQLHGDDFPAPYTDLLWMPSALGYLFVREDAGPLSAVAEAGTFFIQVT